MKELSQVVLGVLAALVSVGIIFGSAALSIAESNHSVSLIVEVQPTSMSYSMRPTSVGTSVTSWPTLSPSPPISVSSASSPTATATFPLLVNCPHPDNWVSVIIEPGDTVERLANAYSTTAEEITHNNCLLIDTLVTGTILWVPPVEKVGKFNQPARICGPPDIWVSYIVKSGDTLYNLSINTGATVSQIQWANCLASSTFIRVGQSLYLPFIPEPTSTRPQVISPTIASTPTRPSAPENKPPTADSQSLTTGKDKPIQIFLTGTDPDGDTLTFYIVGNPEHGDLLGNPPLLTYSPNFGYTGADSFSFKVNDGQVESSPVKVDIIVIKENSVPVAHPQSVNTTEGTPIGITLSGSDLDGDSLTYNIVSQPTNGMVTGNPPNLIYLSDPGFTGIDILTFTVYDGVSNSAPADVHITISAGSNGFIFSADLSFN